MNNETKKLLELIDIVNNKVNSLYGLVLALALLTLFFIGLFIIDL